MASRALPNLGLMGFWDLGTPYKDEMDANLRLVSALLQGRVLDRVAAVPASPANGDIYILTAAPNAQTIAVRDNGAWVYITPRSGWRMFDLAAGRMLHYTGTAWRTVLATSAEAKAATLADVAATPAGVREFMEQYGFTSTFTATATDLSALTGASDRTVVFSFDNTTLNTPVAGSYGRGIMFAGGGNYSTQIVWLNGTDQQWMRFHEGSTWTAWQKTSVEYGSNANGQYVRFPDGTQICWKTVSLGTLSFTAMGGLYYTAAAQAGGAYAASFVGVPGVTSGVLTQAGLGWLTIGAAQTTTAFPSFYIMSANGSAQACTMYLTAIGRWKA